jgi:uncharacterized membrane protein YoaK (UPF0700 family)
VNSPQASARSAVKAARLPDPVMGPLVLLTVLAGVADAITYLELGRVFVANSTGNVVFLGFAAAGATQLSVPASLVAIAAFLLGSLAGGRLASRLGTQRRAWLLRALSLELLLVLAASVVAIVLGHAGDRRYALIAPMSIALGVQNATVRKLAVPDMTTTVLTLTLTGLASDSHLAGGESPRWRRRTSAVVLMLAGAFIGGLLVRNVGVPVALGVMLGLLVLAAGLIRRGADEPVPGAGRSGQLSLTRPGSMARSGRSPKSSNCR